MKDLLLFALYVVAAIVTQLLVLAFYALVFLVVLEIVIHFVHWI